MDNRQWPRRNVSAPKGSTRPARSGTTSWSTIIGAVQQHVYQEESGWFADLAQSNDVDQALLTTKYAEQFDRYMGEDKAALFN